MKMLHIINDSPLGTEKACNVPGIANQPGKNSEVEMEIRIILITDAAFSQNTTGGNNGR
jgi:hypothetical protein